jgi:hypothetical protein
MENNQTREEQLRALATDVKTAQLIEEMILLEKQLDDLKQVDFYRVHPKDKSKIKISPAFYAYHKCLAAYKEIVKLLLKTMGDGEESPLRQYLNELRGRK